MISKFLMDMTGKVYKILPLKESDNVGLKRYLDSVAIQFIGAADTFEVLKTDQRYVEVINTISFFRHNDFTVDQCRREVFKTIETLKKIAKAYED